MRQINERKNYELGVMNYELADACLPRFAQLLVLNS
jgi:hypothetical protein